jgi:histone H3/H4
MVRTKVAVSKKAAAPAPAPAKKKKDAAKRDLLAIPKSVGKRFLRRSGCVRVGESPLQPLNKIARRKSKEVISNALRLALLDGRCTIKTRDMAQALAMSNIRIY